MKKVGIRLLLSLILLTALVVTTAAPVSATKPVRIGIRIDSITEGSIRVQYWWNKIGAHYYIIYIVKDGVGGAINTTGLVYLGGRTPSQSSYVTFNDTDITCGHTYAAYIRLYKNHYKPIRGTFLHSASVPLYCPPPSCSIFYEGFSGAVGSLPAAWATNNSIKTYVINSWYATGTPPELYIDWGDEQYTAYDYWVRTPAINATAATTLNLTFRHRLDIYDFDANFTYSVEVSNDDGLNWTAVLEEIPTEAKYPGYQIGPEVVPIDLGDYLGDNILIRWRLRDCTWHSNGWYIDDVCVNEA